MRPVAIDSDSIPLDAFLKWAGAAPTGGRAKRMIQAGAVRVNGEQERRRSRKLSGGDTVSVAGVGDFQVVRRGSGTTGVEQRR